MLTRLFMFSVMFWLLPYAWLSGEESYLDCDGVKIRFTVDGEGQPVVLIHGFAANAELNWRLPGITAELAKKYRVVAVDVRGHGKSDKPHEQDAYGVEMVNDVIRLLDHLKIKKAHVVGYSMGGFIAMKLLVVHPDRIISATLGGSGGIRDDFDHAWNNAMAKKLAAGDSFEDAFKSTLPDDVKLKASQLAILQILFKNQDNQALAALLQSWPKLSVTYQQLEANKVPVFMIFGSDEDSQTRTYIEGLQGRLGNAKFQVIEGEDHMTTIANDKFRQSVLNFIDANSRK